MSTSQYGVSSSTATQLKADAEPSFANPATLAIVLLLGVSYAFNSADRLIFPALLVPISNNFGLNLAQSGFLTNSYTIFIVVFGAFGGWCMSKVGRKALLVGGLTIYSIFTLITPLASGFVNLTIYRSFTGAGEAFQLCAIWAILGAYFGAKRGTAMGILNTLYGLGAFLGPAWGTRIAMSFDSWRLPFYAFGIAGIVVALAIIVFVPSSFTSAVDHETVAKQPDSKASSGGLFNRNSILLGIAFALCGWSVFAYQSLYPTYLRTQLGFTVVDAGACFGMYGLGAMLALVCGWLSDKLKRIGHLGALALFTINGYVLFHGAWSLPVQAFLSLVEGATLSGYLYPRFVAVVQRSVPPAYVGYAMSLLIPCFYIPGLFSGLFFGWLVGPLGWGYASLLSATLPAALAFVITCFYEPHQVRGEA